MLKVLGSIKFFYFQWLRWLKNYYVLKRKYPTIRLHYKAVCHNSILGEYVSINGEANINSSEIGSYTYIAGAGTIISNSTIGKFCSIGPHVMMGCGTHPTAKYVSTSPMFFSTLGQCQLYFADKSYFEELKPIIIGNDVWVGANVFICDGVTIGDGAIIAAGAVVTKDISPYAVVGGVPAKFIKKRFTDEQISFLLQDRWWDKPLTWLKSNYKLFHNIKDYSEINVVDS